MAPRTQSFCHVTFAFLPFAGVADLAHALVQLGGVLANGIRVAVIEPQGALIHVCKETAGSGGAGGGEGGTRPARTADHVCRAAGTHTCTHTCTCLQSEAETCRDGIWAHMCMLAVRGYGCICEQLRSACTKILYPWINTSTLGTPWGLADRSTEMLQIAEGATAVPWSNGEQEEHSYPPGYQTQLYWRSSDTPTPLPSGCHWPQTDGNWELYRTEISQWHRPHRLTIELTHKLLSAPIFLNTKAVSVSSTAVARQPSEHGTPTSAWELRGRGNGGREKRGQEQVLGMEKHREKEERKSRQGQRRHRLHSAEATRTREASSSRQRGRAAGGAPAHPARIRERLPEQQDGLRNVGRRKVTPSAANHFYRGIAF